LESLSLVRYSTNATEVNFIEVGRDCLQAGRPSCCWTKECRSTEAWM